MSFYASRLYQHVWVGHPAQNPKASSRGLGSGDLSMEALQPEGGASVECKLQDEA